MAHVLYKTLSLLHTLFFCSSNTPLHQIMLHFAVAATTGMAGYLYYLLYINYADVNAGIAETALTGKIIAIGKI